MEKVMRIGNGLSAAQMADWPWFKEAWDIAMNAEHGVAWPTTFAEWMQNVVNATIVGTTSAMSTFVWNETQRVLENTPKLILPCG